MTNFKEIKFDKNFLQNLLYIFNIIIDNISLDYVYSYFDFFYLRKICIKHWELKQFISKYIDLYTKDLVQFLITNTCNSMDEKEVNTKKEIFKENFMKDEYFPELHISCGHIYYLGVDDFLKQNYTKALSKLTIAFTLASGLPNKRFYYSFISKTKNILNKLDNKIISDEDNEESKKKLFQLYQSITKDNVNILSSSFYYFLGRLYYKKWGNKGDDIMGFICIKKAKEHFEKDIGFGSFITYYRKHKAILFFEKNEDKFNEKLKNIGNSNDLEGYGKDNSICPICFENKRIIMYLPCHHLFCKVCNKKIIIENNCPICRSQILFSLNIVTKDEENK